MTREEASTHLFDDWYIENGRLCVDGDKKDAFLEAVGMGIKALRPVSREMVERVWPGCEACKDASLAIGEIQLYGTFEGSIDVSGNMHYCPNCGRPITPVAKKRQVERLEALKDGSTTD